MKIINIEATDIQDAWFQCISSIFDNGFKYIIERGSYVGETRLEFDFITIHIKKPYQEPYDMMLPQIPQHLNIPNPVENGYIELYMQYLMTSDVKEDEAYTYGERLTNVHNLKEVEDGVFDIQDINQIEYWIDVFKKTPNTNQAVLQVAEPQDCKLNDPPCLRHIDMRIKDNVLIFYPYFRSWDLWGGMPANLAGIAVLQKYMADEIGVESGSIVASSKGLHLYKYTHELAKLRINK